MTNESWISTLDKVDVKADGITDWEIENNIREKAKRFLHETMEKFGITEESDAFKRLVEWISDLLMKQDIERLILLDSFNRKRSEIICQTQDNSKNIKERVLKDELLFNNNLADLAYINLKWYEWKNINEVYEIKKQQLKTLESDIQKLQERIDGCNSKWSLKGRLESQKKEKQAEVKILKEDFKTYSFLNPDSRDKIGLYKVKESINKDNWFDASLLEDKDWNLIFNIRWTDNYMDIDDDIRLWIQAIKEVDLWAAKDRWILSEKIWAEILFKIFTLYDLFLAKEQQMETVIKEFEKIKVPDWKKMKVVGHSLWWALAQLLAASYPSKIDSIFTYNAPWLLDFILYWDKIEELKKIMNKDSPVRKKDWCLVKCKELINSEDIKACKSWCDKECYCKLMNLPVYNVVWDKLSIVYMWTPIWKSFDIRSENEKDAEKYIIEIRNRQNLKNTHEIELISLENQESWDYEKINKLKEKIWKLDEEILAKKIKLIDLQKRIVDKKLEDLHKLDEKDKIKTDFNKKIDERIKELEKQKEELLKGWDIKEMFVYLEHPISDNRIDIMCADKNVFTYQKHKKEEDINNQDKLNNNLLN